MRVIDAYVDELRAGLHGPRSAKADLLDEARDSLVDAAEAYEREGLPPDAAERRAVQDFGTALEIVPGYQTELNLAQARRTAILVLAVIAMQPLVWDVLDLIAPTPSGEPSTAYVLLDRFVSWLGVAAMVGAAAAVVATGVGVRYLGARRGLARVTGIFALTMCALLLVTAALLNALGPAGGPLSISWSIIFLAVPLAVVAMSARRCLTAD